jgi:uracil-DNA glycosylase family 4
MNSSTNKKIEKILERQLKFQKMVNLPVDSHELETQCKLSEIYIFKMIEEAVELRKEFPSMLNAWSKVQKTPDISRIKEEMCDVFLFFVNIMLTWKVSLDDLIEVLNSVQKNNFIKVKEKKINVLNNRILSLKSKNKKIGVGQGNLYAKYVFIGQNPSSKIDNGYKFWSDEKDGSSRILLPLLNELDVRNSSYFTNIVKSTTEDNKEPDDETINFWIPYLKEELEIIKENNNKSVIVSLGKFVDSVLNKNNIKHVSIYHPAAIMRGSCSKKQYKDQIKKIVNEK